MGIYLGHSPVHAGLVDLVLNPRTGHVSPQYHVVFDEHFTTVANMHSGTIPANWKKLVESSSESATNERFDVSNTWLAQDIEPIIHNPCDQPMDLQASKAAPKKIAQSSTQPLSCVPGTTSETPESARKGEITSEVPSDAPSADPTDSLPARTEPTSL